MDLRIIDWNLGGRVDVQRQLEFMDSLGWDVLLLQDVPRKRFDVFRDYYLSEQDLDYREVAARYGITVSSVSNYLTHAKRRYRSLLRSLVTETVASTEELEQELAWLFGAGAR